ncbi:unnamed protein product [Echinostoma caproni]|uniref:Carboxylic ester hydrolase n=1 Tax=Echinostoma caproni TaxID=27848 RepID=A0A183A698_9TREM|nr:unnamed protein product [Echinostoma caproni]
MADPYSFLSTYPIQSGFVLLILCLTISPVKSSTAEPEVTLSHGGKVRGKTVAVTIGGSPVNVDHFLGIPFAKPPVNTLRFADPVKHQGWSGTKYTVSLPPTCWQYLFLGFDQANPGARMWANNTEMSEDCLYLNVWRPTGTGTTKLPVMVWVYGGGYTTGTSTIEVYNGQYLAAKHKIIIVSMQYRLGAFGFLRIDPSPSRFRKGLDKVALGNMGLKDQLLALEWVKSEIDLFGGDPSQVTVFGESSGAVSVSALWTSPKTKNLFRRAIVQSGAIISRWGLHDLKMANHRAAVFSKACNCPDPAADPAMTIRCLQKVDPMDLVNNLDSIHEDDGVQRNKTMWENFFKKMTKSQLGKGAYPGWATSSRRYFEVPLSAVIDGDFLPTHPREILKSPQKFRPTTELLIGVNQDEAIYFLLYGLSMENTVFLSDTGQVSLPESIKKSGLREVLGSTGQRADFQWITALEILDQKYLHPELTALPAAFYNLPMMLNTSTGYSNPNNIKLTGEEVMKRLSDLASDVDFVCPVLEFADLAARRSEAKVYLYYFTQPSSKLPFPAWTGVMHGYEIHYVFGMPHSTDFTKTFFGFTDEEIKFGELMQQLWVNFAKTG